jgi:cell division protease FtsH
VTFAPDVRGGPPPAVRALLFWLLMVFLAGVLWKTASTSPRSNSAATIKYSDFMNCVDDGQVTAATLIVSQNTAEIQGQLRDPSRKFAVTIPKEVIPDLTERLRKQGVSIEVSQNAAPNWQRTALSIAPLIILVGFWFAIMRRRSARLDAPSPSDPSNRPLG